MATVDGMTVARINEITNAAVVGASIDANTGALTLQTRDNHTINVGTVSSVSEAVDKAYPVGSLFFSVIATDPATQLGVGTWQAFAIGRTIFGVDPNQTEFNASEKTGGEKTHTLTLTEVPRHAHTGGDHSHPINHDHPSVTSSSDTHSHTLSFTQQGDATTTSIYSRVTNIDNQVPSSGGTSYTAHTSSDTHSHTVDIPNFSGSSGSASSYTSGFAGGNADNTTQPHNNLPPYITCYIWKRTA